jgi:sugar (pentulose or hexulose) kinase
MQEVYLIYDIGKTNKKCLVFTSDGEVVDEYLEKFEEIVDEDGFPCDDLQKLEDWVLGQYELLLKNERYQIIGINFATYGASFVHIDANGKPLTPLYNYLKPYPKNIEKQFLACFFNDDPKAFALATTSPFMGMLNSGLQLYWLKCTQPEVWGQVAFSLHLPQYLSHLFTKKATTDFTSIGCHTGLWDYEKNNYQQWVLQEALDEKLPPIGNAIFYNDKHIAIGTGLHDSSSALIPYLQQYKEPFLLISTGTWCICLNPFNQKKLTIKELQNDVLHFLQVNGAQVKAARIFLGKEHDYQVARISKHFAIDIDFFKTYAVKPVPITENSFIPACMEGTGPMPDKQNELWDISRYKSAEEAYHGLMRGLVQLLHHSIGLIDTETVKHFYIDGGFADNKLFIDYLQQFYPHKKVSTVAFPQSTALGAFLHLKK